MGEGSWKLLTHLSLWHLCLDLYGQQSDGGSSSWNRQRMSLLEESPSLHRWHWMSSLQCPKLECTRHCWGWGAMTLEAPRHFPIPSPYSFLTPCFWKPPNHASQNSPTETQRGLQSPKESDFLTFVMNQRGLTQQVLFWRVGGKTKQNTMKQQPTCTNNRWTPLLGEELLKQMAYSTFPFRPTSLSVAGFRDIKSQWSNTSLQSDGVSGRGSHWSRCDPCKVELSSLSWSSHETPSLPRRCISHIHNILP